MDFDAECCTCFKRILLSIIIVLIIVLLPIICVFLQISYPIYQGSNHILSNLYSQPILDFQKSSSGICPINYSILPLGKSFQIYFDGDQDDYCIDKGILVKREYASSGAICDKNNLKVNSKRPLHFLKWKGETICVKLLESNYLDLLRIGGDANCPKDFKSCGLLDTLDNLLCIPKNEDCPINYFKIVSRQFVNPDPNKIKRLSISFFDILYSNDIDNSSIANTLEKKNKKVISQFLATINGVCAMPHESDFEGNNNNFIFVEGKYFNKCKTKVSSSNLNPHYSLVDSDNAEGFEQRNNVYKYSSAMSSSLKIFSDDSNYNLYYTTYYGLRTDCKFNYLGLNQYSWNNLELNIQTLWLVFFLFNLFILIFGILYFTCTCCETRDCDSDCKFKCCCSCFFVISSFIMTVISISIMWSFYGSVVDNFFNIKFYEKENFCSDSFTNEVYSYYYNYNSDFVKYLLVTGVLNALLLVLLIIYLVVAGIERDKEQSGDGDCCDSCCDD